MLVYRSVTAFWVDSLTFHHHVSGDLGGLVALVCPSFIPRCEKNLSVPWPKKKNGNMSPMSHPINLLLKFPGFTWNLHGWNDIIPKFERGTTPPKKRTAGHLKILSPCKKEKLNQPKPPNFWGSMISFLGFVVVSSPLTPPKFNRSPLKNDGWKMILSFLDVLFLGAMLNFWGV